MSSDIPFLLRHLEVSFQPPEKPSPKFDVVKANELDETTERKTGIIARLFHSEAVFERRRERNAERAVQREAREKYILEVEKYERLKESSAAEKKMIAQFNSTIKDAILLLAADIAAEKKRIIDREAWEENAKLAYSLFFAWRTQFAADCVATHGPRTEDEIDRLSLEAYPYSPISGDDRLGYLHKYAGTHKAVKQIKHLLPKEVPYP